MVEEYPRNLMELEANFATEEACRVYLAQLRWSAGFRCPRCGSEKAWPVRGLWECGGCGCQTSVTAGTIFQDTRHLVSSLRLREQVLVFLDMATGLRRGELAGLKWEDVDFHNLQLNVCRSLVDQRVGKCKTEASKSRRPSTST